VQALVALYFSRKFLASDWTVAYLIKPFSGEELLDAVNAALKWKPSDRLERKHLN
jgi:DNA-binding response OmpR family regulator